MIYQRFYSLFLKFNLEEGLPLCHTLNDSFWVEAINLCSSHFFFHPKILSEFNGSLSAVALFQSLIRKIISMRTIKPQMFPRSQTNSNSQNVQLPFTISQKLALVKVKPARLIVIVVIVKKISLHGRCQNRETRALLDQTCPSSRSYRFDKR